MLDSASSRRLGRNIAVYLSLLLVVGSVAVVYLEHETPVYFWDYSNYHNQFITLVSAVRSQGLFAVFSSILHDVRYSDYNPLPVVPLIPFGLLLGASRLVYIVSLIILVLPFVIGLAAELSQLCWLPRRRPILLTFFLFVPLFSPLLWASPLRGYPDFIALIPLGIVSIRGISSFHFLRCPARASLLYGLLLWLCFALRRYFAYALIVFFVVHAGCGLWHAARAAQWRQYFRNYGCLLCGIALPLIVFQSGLVFRIFNTQYHHLYSAYDLGFSGNLSALHSLTGSIWPLIWVIGLVLAALARRPWVLFHAGLAFSSYLFFQFTQKTGPHHLLPLVLWLVPAASWPVWLARHHLKSLALRTTIPVLSVLVFGLLWLANFWPPLCRFPAGSPGLWLCPPRRFPPLQHEHYEDLLLFVARLRRIVPNGARIAVAASSTEFNSEILSALLDDRASGNPYSTYSVQSLGDIDQRDGFNLALFQSADYLVIPYEPLLHRPARFQRVVTVPVQLFRSNSYPLNRTWSEVGTGSDWRSSSFVAGLRVYKRTASIPGALVQAEASLLIGQLSATTRSAALKDGIVILR